jgi:hypothetical protein
MQFNLSMTKKGIWVTKCIKAKKHSLTASGFAQCIPNSERSKNTGGAEDLCLSCDKAPALRMSVWIGGQ